jgi:hypothetical protein
VAAFRQIGGGYVLESDAGEFTVYTEVVTDAGKVAGPGYVARWKSPSGQMLVDGLEDGFVSANDPEIGGIGIPAWHHFRANGEADIWRRGWEINPLRKAPAGVAASRVLDGPRIDAKGNIRLSIATEFADVYEPVMSVRHDYILEKLALRAWITFTQRWQGGGFRAFLKEPKLTVDSPHRSRPSRSTTPRRESSSRRTSRRCAIPRSTLSSSAAQDGCARALYPVT